MEYNKFIYKINKYKSFQKDSDRKRKDHYQKKINFYYKKVDELIENIKNHKGGGAFTDADLMQFLEPTTNQLNEHLDKKANITVFQAEQKKYEVNHKKIIDYLNKLLEANDLLRDLNDKADDELDKIKAQLSSMEETHRKEIQEKLQQIKQKVEEQKKLTLEDIKTKYKFKI